MAREINNVVTRSQLCLNGGDVVTYERDDGSLEERVVRWPVEMLGGHTAVIWLEGIPGCVALCRVKPGPKTTPNIRSQE